MNVTAVLASLALVTSAAPRAESSTSTIGDTTATTTVRGKEVKVHVERGRTGYDATIHLAERCVAKRLAEVMATEITQNRDAFRVDRLGRIDLWAAVPGRGGGGGRGDDKDDTPGTFEAQIADLLSTGTHVSGSGAGGQTCWSAFSFDVGALLQANLADPPANADVDTARDGSTTKTATQGGITTIWSSDASGQHVSVSSVMSPASGGDSGYTSGSQITVSATRDSTLAHELAHTVQQGSGSSQSRGGGSGSDTTTTTTTTVTTDSGGDTTSSSRTQSTTSGGNTTSVTETHTVHAGETTTSVEVKVNQQTIFQNQQSSGSSGSSGRSKTGGTKKSKFSGAGGMPTVTPEGTVNMPPMCIADEFVGALINWNRLQEAVTNPSPIATAEGEPTKADDTGPCGNATDDDFDPNPAYLMPNKRGWVVDPVPFLRRTSTRRR